LQREPRTAADDRDPEKSDGLLREGSSRSAPVSSPAAPSPWSALARRYQPRRDSELMPSSRTTAVTVFPEESTSATASRLNSSVYRFVYLLPTWCYFLWNLKIPVSRCPRSRGSFNLVALPALRVGWDGPACGNDSAALLPGAVPGVGADSWPKRASAGVLSPLFGLAKQDPIRRPSGACGPRAAHLTRQPDR
jgi:hypothetical protein